MKTSLCNIYVRRWLDKTYGNYYYNFRVNIKNLTNNESTNIEPTEKLHYGYGSQSFYDAKEFLKKQGHDLDKYIIQEIDFGYGLKRDLKNV